MTTDTDLTPDTTGGTDEETLVRPDRTSEDPKPQPPEKGRGKLAVGLMFAAPALLLLGAFIVYPTIFTIIRSLYGRTGAEFVGLDNYAAMFDSPQIVTAIKNNVIWVVVAPSFATAFGLVFAVLTERIRWSTAFKLVIFMPMAISFLAVGIIFRLVYQDNPEQGLANAATQGVVHVFRPPGDFPGGEPSQPDRFDADPDAGWILRTIATPGEPVALGVNGIAPSLLPEDGTDATAPQATEGISGVVFRDFSPDGELGSVDAGEIGLPGVQVSALDGEGAVIATARTDETGQFAFSGLTDRDVRLRLDEASFREPWGGISWLGPTLVTPAIIASFVWMWAGFAMMVIAAGLSSIPRETLEAARVDGGTEWQVFKKVMAPQLKPVLVVVFVTLMINVLKIFDLVLIVPPGSSQDDATVLALEMWRVAFGGPQDQGLGSAIAVLLLLLVLPAMAFNLRRFLMEDK